MQPAAAEPAEGSRRAFGGRMGEWVRYEHNARVWAQNAAPLAPTLSREGRGRFGGGGSLALLAFLVGQRLLPLLDELKGF